MEITILSNFFADCLNTICCATTPKKISSVQVTAKGTELIFKSCDSRIAATFSVDSTKKTDIDLSIIKDGVLIFDKEQTLSAVSSFKKGTVINISCSNEDPSDVKISNVSNNESFQTVRSLNDFEYPDLNFGDGKGISIKTGLFGYAASKISSGFAAEQTGAYSFWSLKLKKDKMRFASCTGAYLNILDILTSSKVEKDIFIPIEFTENILNVLSFAEPDEFEIIEVDINGNRYLKFQGNGFSMIVSGMQNGNVWPDEGKLLTNAYTVVSSISKEDLQEAIDGSLATFTADLKKSATAHKTFLKFDFGKKVVSIGASSVLKSSRKISLLDASEASGTKECVTYTDYLSRAIKPTKDSIQVALSSASDKAPIFFSSSPSSKDIYETFENDLGLKEMFVSIFVQASD